MALVFAVAYAILTATTVIIDRYLFAGIIDEPGALLVTSKFSSLLIALGVAAVWVVEVPQSMTVIALIIVIGIIKTLPLYQYFRVIREADASVVSPIVGTQPIAIVILGFLVLGERLSLIEYAGVGFIVLGSLLLMTTKFIDSWTSFNSLRAQLVLNEHALWAYILALVWSFEAVLLKLVLGVEGIITVFVWTSIVSGSLALLFILRENVRGDLSGLTDASPRQLSIYVVSEFISAVAWFTAIAAYAYGPISLVGPVIHTYSVFVFVFVILIHLIGPTIDQELTGNNMKWKAFSAVCTVFGIAILYVV